MTLYFDSVVFGEREFRHLIEIWGADHIMLSTDYPFDMAESDPAGFLHRVKSVGEKNITLVVGGNLHGSLECRPGRHRSPELSRDLADNHRR